MVYKQKKQVKLDGTINFHFSIVLKSKVNQYILQLQVMNMFVN